MTLPRCAGCSADAVYHAMDESDRRCFEACDACYWDAKKHKRANLTIVGFHQPYRVATCPRGCR